MQAFYTDRFVLPLPAGHRFPMEKYRLLREQVAAQLPGVTLTEPPPAADIDLARAHDPEYIDRLAGGQLTKIEQQKMQLVHHCFQVDQRTKKGILPQIYPCPKLPEGAILLE